LRDRLDRLAELPERHPLQSPGHALLRRETDSSLLLAAAGFAALAHGARERDARSDGEAGGECRRQRRDNGAAMPSLPPAPWWTVRRAANRKPATYRCPICGHHLPALSEHMLIAPEGDTRRRRHAHTECVLRARSRGELPLREEWQLSRPRRPPLWRRLMRRG
jgi:hypothetical protein